MLAASSFWIAESIAIVVNRRVCKTFWFIIISLRSIHSSFRSWIDDFGSIHFRPEQFSSDSSFYIEFNLASFKLFRVLNKYLFTKYLFKYYEYERARVLLALAKAYSNQIVGLHFTYIFIWIHSYSHQHNLQLSVASHFWINPHAVRIWFAVSLLHALIFCILFLNTLA